MRRPATAFGAALLCAVAAEAPAFARSHAKPTPPPAFVIPDAVLDRAVPRYDHIVVIVEENHGTDEIVGNRNAPNLTALAAGYGNAASMFAEAHPSEPNYLAMIGGETLGIRDDDAWYCGPADARPYCGGAKRAGYASHETTAISLPEQLLARRLTWRGYFGGLPRAIATSVISPASPGEPPALYAAKHNPFLNFVPLRTAADFGRHVVPLEAFVHDVRAGALPSFAFVVPNQCEDMHGMMPGPHVPRSCLFLNQAELVRRADRVAADLVGLVQASPAWSSAQNVAVIITWDESDGSTSGPPGCCERGRDAAAGGGRIPTIVVTNHGPRGLADATPYNHYSLLRTIEDAFGVYDHLGHAADRDAGVVPMTPLFQLAPPKAVPRPS